MKIVIKEDVDFTAVVNIRGRTLMATAMVASRYDEDRYMLLSDATSNRVVATLSDGLIDGFEIAVDATGRPVGLKVGDIVISEIPTEYVDTVASMIDQETLAWRDRLTPDLLRQVGEAVHGRQWQTPLAGSLGISDRHLRKWIAGDRPIPADLLKTLVDLLRWKHQQVQSARDRVALIYVDAIL